MNADLTRSIVRILDTASKTCGTGFVVYAGDDSRIVTCAHVVKLAKSGPGQSIALTFSPFDLARSAKQYSAMVEPAYWRDAHAEDLAVLHLEELLPGGVEPLRLGSSLGSEDHVFQSFGFGEAKPTDGLWGQCTVRGLTSENGFPVWQMDSGEVSHGFSGAPVWDKELQVVIGVVTSIARPDSRGRQTRVNFVIPAETLARVCPDLQITDECPYRGLSTFTEEDAAVFFGREQAIKELLKKLRANPQFLAVFGPSGSGKSSLVRSGVIPRLQEEHRPQGKAWGIIVTRPADNPFKQLSHQGLELEPGGLIGGVRGWLKQHPDNQRLLLVIDQFEELFVTCHEAQRRFFIKQLTQLRNEAFTTIIVVMRHDFYSQFVEHEALREWLAMSGGATDIPQTLKRNDVLDIILKPAERYRLRFQEALPDLIMRDVMEESSHTGEEDEETAQCTVLPLLEFLLTQLWERRQQGVLTGEAYRAIGGVAGGLTRWANHVLTRLGEERLPLVERVFLALVHLGDEASRQPDSRQPASLASLTALCRNDSERAALQHVIQEMVNARLLVIHGDRHRHENTVEIIHEALLQHWSTLKYWIASNRDFLQWRQGLEQRAQAWIETNPVDASQRDEWRLLRGRDLTAAEDMLNTRSDELTAMHREYILASQKQMANELEKERQRTTELKAALEIALARGLAAQAEVQISRYRRQSQKPIDLEDEYIDLMNELEWKEFQQQDPSVKRLLERSTLLVMESMQRFPTLEGDQALRLGMAMLGHRYATIHHRHSVRALAFSPDGRYLATACDDGTVGLWEVSSGRRLKAVPHNGVVSAVAFSRDGRRLATGSWDGMARVWEIASRSRHALFDHQEEVSAVAFSPDGRWLATGSWDGMARVWEIATGDCLTSLHHRSHVLDVAFSPDGRWLVTASGDLYGFGPGSAEVWETSSFRCRHSLSHQSMVSAVAFSPDGKYLATASRDATVGVWEISTGRLRAFLPNDEGVSAVAFSPDGKYLATADLDNKIRIREISADRFLVHIAYEKSVNDLAFSPDGKYLAAASSDHTVRFWLWQAKDLLAEAQTLLTRNLTLEEWKQYFGDEPYRKTCPNLP